MRNPLDLNNLPEDFSRDHPKQPLDDSSSASGGSSSCYRSKKKSGGKDESGKVYECRFCSLKFCKSQALGGHMNRHRQERETETLNRARQLVFSNDSLLSQPSHQLGGQPVAHGGYHHHHHHQHQAAGCNMGGTLYPTSRLFSTTSTTALPPPPPHIYGSPAASRLNIPYSHSINDYFVGHVCSNNPQFNLQNLSCTVAPPPDGANNYTCIGAPVGQGFAGAGASGGGGRDLSPSRVNRYHHQDGF